MAPSKTLVIVALLLVLAHLHQTDSARVTIITLRRRPKNGTESEPRAGLAPSDRQTTTASPPKTPEDLILHALDTWPIGRYLSERYNGTTR